MRILSLSSISYKFLVFLAIVAIVFSALPVQIAEAAHTFDSKVRYEGTANPLTQSYTIGSGGTLLVVSIVTAGKTARTGGAPTYNGVSLTQANTTKVAIETVTELWYLTSPPTGSAYTINIPNSGGLTLHVIASSYMAQSGYTTEFDVANGTVTGNLGSNMPTVSVTTTTDGSIIVGAMGNGSNIVPKNRSGTTLFETLNATYSDNGQYFLQTSAGTYDMSWTMGQFPNDWGFVVAAFKEVPLPPTVTVEQAAGQVDPTATSPINFTVVFSRPVTGFSTGDVTLSGTAGATSGIVSEIAPNDGTTYNVAVSGMSGDGTVIASVDAGVAFDAVHNAGNEASTSTDNQVTYNTGLPETSIDSNPTNPSNSQDATFTFSSPNLDVVGFECQLDSGGFASCTTPKNYTGLSAGSHTFEVRAIDIANNMDLTPASFTWVIDLGYPTVSSSTPANNATVTSGPSQLIIDFSEDVKNDGSAGAANNIANYLLIEDGVNNSFDTIATDACSSGIVADDTLIAIDTATYTNNGGSGPFVATLSINGGVPLPVGSYRLFVCGTKSIQDLGGNELNNGLSDTRIDFTVEQNQSGGGGGGGGAEPINTLLPATGFPQGVVTTLSTQPADQIYTSFSGNLWLEIPKMGVKTSIVGVPSTANSWNVSWLGSNAGWLNGSAFPTWSGNSVITAHVWDALNRPGVFANLKNLKYGDQVKVHAFGQVYTYEIRESSAVLQTSFSVVFKHEDKSWITLVTCEGYQELSGEYASRRMVRAVLVNVTSE